MKDRMPNDGPNVLFSVAHTCLRVQKDFAKADLRQENSRCCKYHLNVMVVFVNTWRHVVGSYMQLVVAIYRKCGPGLHANRNLSSLPTTQL